MDDSVFCLTFIVSDGNVPSRKGPYAIGPKVLSYKNTVMSA